MANNNGQNNGLIDKIIVPIVLALIVGGTVPWWWQYTPWYNFDNQQTQRTSIIIAYSGDLYGCSLPLIIRIGDKEFAPQGNSFLVDGVKVGQQNYQINGIINCHIFGSCQAHGTGSIKIIPSRTYNVLWDANTCKVILQ